MDPTQKLIEALARLSAAGLSVPAGDDLMALHAWAVAEAGARHAGVDRSRLDEVIGLLTVVRDGDEAQQAKAKAALAKRAAAAAVTDDAGDDAAALASGETVVTRKRKVVDAKASEAIVEAGACVACKHPHSETPGGACDQADCDCGFRMKESEPDEDAYSDDDIDQADDELDELDDDPDDDDLAEADKKKGTFYKGKDGRFSSQSDAVKTYTGASPGAGDEKGAKGKGNGKGGGDADDAADAKKKLDSVNRKDVRADVRAQVGKDDLAAGKADRIAARTARIAAKDPTVTPEQAAELAKKRDSAFRLKTRVARARKGLGLKKLKASEAIVAPVAEAADGPVPAILEAISTDARKGKVFDVLLIAAGTSANRRRYRPEVLRAAVPLFEGVRAFAGAGPDHSPAERGSRSLVGWYTDARYAEGIKTPKAVREGIAAHFHVSKGAGWLSDLMEDGLEAGKSDLVGFSLVGDGTQTPVREGKGQPPIFDVDPITVIDSVDVVTNPAAGGHPLRLVASKENPLMEWSTLTLVEAVKRLASGAILPQELSEHRPDLAAALTEGRIAEASLAAPTPVVAPSALSPVPDFAALIEAQLGPMRTATLVEAKLGARRNLPAAVAAKLREAFSGKTMTDVEVEAAIQAEVDYIASFNPAVIRESGLAGVTDMKTERERIVEGMYDVLAGKSQTSIRKMYVDLTGDHDFNGRIAESGRLSESILSTTFAEITLDAMHKRVLDYYAVPGLDTWRQIADTVPLSDLKTQHRIRWGGYGNLPAVSEGNEYLPLTSPGDEEATYSPIKRGGTEDLTLEMIMNDDIKSMRDIPRRLGRAAAQTLHEFVFDFLRLNPVVYDGLALAHANHGNLATSALASAAVIAARQRMLKQTDMSSAKRLAIRPKNLIIPLDLEEQAFGLLNSDKVLGSNNNDPSFVKKFGLDLIVVEYWTDANDWWLTADKASAPLIEIGFVQGREEPEIFLQDEPTVGRVFSHDKLTYKIRHWFGGVVLDVRAAQGNIVA